MKQEILKFFKGDVEDSAGILRQYSHDASLLEIKPKLVLFPKDAEDIKNLVKWAGTLKRDEGWQVSLTPRCAGTDMSGGAIGESIILDFTRYMNKLVGGPLPLEASALRINGKEYPKVPSYITVMPGMFYRDFEKITEKKELVLPCYTASKTINALGGMFGNNSAGERTLKYGQMEKYILSSRVVFSDGNEYEVKPLSKKELESKISQNDFEGDIYKKVRELLIRNEDEISRAKPKVSKNSTGYYLWNIRNEEMFDLNRLLVGSQGTLGIITEMTLKLLPEKKHSKLVAIFVNDLSPLGRIVDDILTLDPETLETYDDKTMKLAVRFFPDFLKNKGPIGMLKLAVRFLPEFFMMLRGGFPKLIVMVEFAGENEELLEKKCQSLAEKIKSYNLKIHITKSESEAGKYWDIRRQSFALLRKHVRGSRTAPFIDDIIVRPEFLPKFIPELNLILKEYKLTYALAGHAGDGNFHVIPLMDFKRKDTAKIILELSDKVFDLVGKYRGSIAAEHNDGLIRTPYLPKMYNERMIELFKETKKIFDPDNIFNPGKKVPADSGGGTKEYIASHIAVEHDAEHGV